MQKKYGKLINQPVNKVIKIKKKKYLIKIIFYINF